ncbi:hypothetical protein H6501_05940 [Candidatus Woesearchaeota archaeon]|nr:hypothetical protein [Nanoarchaeota archaeon]MCB9371114.1 hypothetical protein [Candidatus Woesearchaeota archaeon]USN44168.1 MAG: hypothetical protein H6500_07310 [Candidatus Woesearchaeota archaeon]
MINRDELFLFFSELDKQLSEKYPNIKIDIFLLGGTYFVLEELRPSSLDIDILLLDAASYRIVLEVAESVKKKYFSLLLDRGLETKYTLSDFSFDILFGVQLGEIFLPKNFSNMAKQYRRSRSSFTCIKLWTLSPYDILISKLFRNQEKDARDIALLMDSGHFRFRKKILERRMEAFQMNSYQRVLLKRNYSMFLQKFEDKLFSSLWQRFRI